MASACSEMSTGGTQAVVAPSWDSRLKKSASTGSFVMLRVVSNIPFASFQDGNHSRPHGLATRGLQPPCRSGGPRVCQDDKRVAPAWHCRCQLCRPLGGLRPPREALSFAAPVKLLSSILALAALAGGRAAGHQAPVEMFPTTIALTPDGELAFVANSDFHGDHPRKNVVSVVYTGPMLTLAQLPACDMPHGVRVNHAGTRVYVSCMNSDELLEIDRETLGIARRHPTGGMTMPATTGHEGTKGGAIRDACMPTFVSVSPDDRRLYVACNASDALQVVDAGTLELLRAVPTGHGAYNVEPSPDGRWVIVTNKKDRSVSLFDAATLTEAARIPTSKQLPHGIAYAPDGRFAFVSVESVGADPGAVDVIDLTTKTRVATTPIPLQPTGIAILRRP